MLLNPKKAASYLGLQPQTLNAWRSARKNLPFCKVGGRIFYRQGDLDNFIKRINV